MQNHLSKRLASLFKVSEDSLAPFIAPSKQRGQTGVWCISVLRLKAVLAKQGLPFDTTLLKQVHFYCKSLFINLPLQIEPDEYTEDIQIGEQFVSFKMRRTKLVEIIMNQFKSTPLIENEDKLTVICSFPAPGVKPTFLRQLLIAQFYQRAYSNVGRTVEIMFLPDALMNPIESTSRDSSDSLNVHQDLWNEGVGEVNLALKNHLKQLLADLQSWVNVTGHFLEWNPASCKKSLESIRQIKNIEFIEASEGDTRIRFPCDTILSLISRSQRPSFPMLLFNLVSTLQKSEVIYIGRSSERDKCNQIKELLSSSSPTVSFAFHCVGDLVNFPSLDSTTLATLSRESKRETITNLIQKEIEVNTEEELEEIADRVCISSLNSQILRNKMDKVISVSDVVEDREIGVYIQYTHTKLCG